jgi:DNA-binding NarL/FixJ family response regulator
VATERANLRAAVPLATPATVVALLAEAASDGRLQAALGARGWRVVVDTSEAEALIVKAERPRSAIVEIVDDLRERAAGRPIVVVLDDAAAADRALVRDLVGRGVSAVVATSRIADALTVSIEAALAGQIALPGGFAGAGRPTLTVREKQVLGMVVLGFTNGEIAQKLFVAESTVKSHLSSAFAKLGVRSRNEATEAILDPVNGLGTGILAIGGAESQRQIPSPTISQL